RCLYRADGGPRPAPLPSRSSRARARSTLARARPPGQARVELDAAHAAAQPDLAQEGDYVASVDDLDRRVVEEFPGLAQVGRPFAKARVPAVDAWHPRDEPLVWSLVVVVGREAHEAQIEIPAHQAPQPDSALRRSRARRNRDRGAKSRSARESAAHALGQRTISLSSPLRRVVRR